MYSLGMSGPLILLGLLERQPSHGYDVKRDCDTGREVIAQDRGVTATERVAL